MVQQQQQQPQRQQQQQQQQHAHLSLPPPPSSSGGLPSTPSSNSQRSQQQPDLGPRGSFVDIDADDGEDEDFSSLSKKKASREARLAHLHHRVGFLNSQISELKIAALAREGSLKAAREAGVEAIDRLLEDLAAQRADLLARNSAGPAATTTATAATASASTSASVPALNPPAMIRGRTRGAREDGNRRRSTARAESPSPPRPSVSRAGESASSGSSSSATTPPGPPLADHWRQSRRHGDPEVFLRAQIALRDEEIEYLKEELAKRPVLEQGVGAGDSEALRLAVWQTEVGPRDHLIHCLEQEVIALQGIIADQSRALAELEDMRLQVRLRDDTILDLRAQVASLAPQRPRQQDESSRDSRGSAGGRMISPTSDIVTPLAEELVMMAMDVQASSSSADDRGSSVGELRAELERKRSLLAAAKERLDEALKGREQLQHDYTILLQNYRALLAERPAATREERVEHLVRGSMTVVRPVRRTLTATDVPLMEGIGVQAGPADLSAPALFAAGAAGGADLPSSSRFGGGVGGSPSRAPVAYPYFSALRPTSLKLLWAYQVLGRRFVLGAPPAVLVPAPADEDDDTESVDNNHHRSAHHHLHHHHLHHHPRGIHHPHPHLHHQHQHQQHHPLHPPPHHRAHHPLHPGVHHHPHVLYHHAPHPHVGVLHHHSAPYGQSFMPPPGHQTHRVFSPPGGSPSAGSAPLGSGLRHGSLPLSQPSFMPSPPVSMRLASSPYARTANLLGIPPQWQSSPYMRF
jgi:hypothetical protein